VPVGESQITGLLMKATHRACQATLADRITLTGIGVHSGMPASLTINPADPNTGIVFVRSDLSDGGTTDIAAHYSVVCATDLCTVIGDMSASSVSTVEHLMAALSAFGVDNAMIEVDSAEVPIMDGSSEAFCAALRETGLREQAAKRRYIRVLKPVRVQMGKSYGELRPNDCFSLDVEIEFDTSVIGRQRYRGDLTAERFETELSRARTFGFMKDVEQLWGAGFALGASLENTIVLGDDNVVNPEGTRYSDEFVRHKALDAVGDLALAGAPILGAFSSFRGGHKLNRAVLAALFADESAYCIEEFDMPASPALDVAAKRDAGYVEPGHRIPMAAYGPEKS